MLDIIWPVLLDIIWPVLLSAHRDLIVFFKLVLYINMYYIYNIIYIELFIDHQTISWYT